MTTTARSGATSTLSSAMTTSTAQCNIDIAIQLNHSALQAQGPVCQFNWYERLPGFESCCANNAKLHYTLNCTQYCVAPETNITISEFASCIRKVAQESDVGLIKCLPKTLATSIAASKTAISGWITVLLALSATGLLPA